MSRKYKNPPLEEVLCYFEFIPSREWDDSIPEQIFEQIKKEYPEKRILDKPDAQSINLIQFYNEGKPSLVNVGTNFLSVNHLKPYPTWENYKPLAIRMLEIYTGIASPIGFKYLGLRYMNRVIFPNIKNKLGENLNFFVMLPSNLPQNFDSFDSIIGIPYNEHEHLNLRIMSLEYPDPEGLSFLLDLDYVLEKPDINFDQVSGWLEKAHANIEEAFESCFTEKCKKDFFGVIE